MKMYYLINILFLYAILDYFFYLNIINYHLKFNYRLLLNQYHSCASIHCFINWGRKRQIYLQECPHLLIRTDDEHPLKYQLLWERRQTSTNFGSCLWSARSLFSGTFVNVWGCLVRLMLTRLKLYSLYFNSSIGC